MLTSVVHHQKAYSEQLCLGLQFRSESTKTKHTKREPLSIRSHETHYLRPSLSDARATFACVNRSPRAPQGKVQKKMSKTHRANSTKHPCNPFIALTPAKTNDKMCHKWRNENGKETSTQNYQRKCGARKTFSVPQSTRTATILLHSSPICNSHVHAIIFRSAKETARSDEWKMRGCYRSPPFTDYTARW